MSIINVIDFHFVSIAQKFHQKFCFASLSGNMLVHFKRSTFFLNSAFSFSALARILILTEVLSDAENDLIFLIPTGQKNERFMYSCFTFFLALGFLSVDSTEDLPVFCEWHPSATLSDETPGDIPENYGHPRSTSKGTQWTQRSSIALISIGIGWLCFTTKQPHHIFRHVVRWFSGYRLRQICSFSSKVFLNLPLKSVPNWAKALRASLTVRYSNLSFKYFTCR